MKCLLIPIRLILCGALLAIGVLAAPFPSHAQIATDAPTRPAPTPTLACVNAARTRLIVRERARVIADNGLNLREETSTTAPLILRIDQDAIVFVLEGPVCSARYAWYRVAVDDDEGWIAEAGTEGYYIEVYPPG